MSRSKKTTETHTGLKKHSSFKMIVLCASLLGRGQYTTAQNCNSYTKQIMEGVSNYGRTNDKEYLTAGDKAYVVGTQNGNFPDLGSHVKGEMGGLWIPPVKLMDGFWLKISDIQTREDSWLKEAKEFINYPYGNRFVYAPVLDGIKVERFQFCPQGKQGMIIQYEINNNSVQSRKLQLEFLVKTDLSPVWFSKENNIIDAADSVSWIKERNLFEANDLNHPWFTIWGSSLKPMTHNTRAVGPVETSGLGKAASTTYQLTLDPHQTFTAVFVIAGSDKNLQTAEKNYDAIYLNQEQLLTEKKQHYEQVIKRARVDIPDKKLQQAYTWGKVNTEWLVSDIPGMGRFLGAGAVEYPWLFGCDNTYASQGVVASGDLQLAESTLRTLKQMSEKVNGNGRILHEMSSNGFVSNKGNVQETPHFAVAVWKVFEWTGDIEFLAEMYPYIKKGINWLLTKQDQNKDLFPEGTGIMEVKGLNAELIDVAVYTKQALEAASKMASIFRETDLQTDYAHKAAILKDKINRCFWEESQSTYCDFYGTKEEALSVAKGSIEQLQSDLINTVDSSYIFKNQNYYRNLIRKFSALPEGTKKGWLTNKNWVISTPAETHIAPYDKAIRLLDEVRKEDCGPYGPYLSAVEGRYMMTIATGVQAVAECEYNRTDEAMWYVDKIAQTFSKVLPGSISEMMPDYGCPVQAWTIYGLATPLVTYVLGIKPDAFHKSIMISPNLPRGWDYAGIYDLPVGSNTISFIIRKKGKRTSYQLQSNDANWTYTIVMKGLAGKKYTLNHKVYTATTDRISLNGKFNGIEVLH